MNYSPSSSSSSIFWTVQRRITKERMLFRRFLRKKRVSLSVTSLWWKKKRIPKNCSRIWERMENPHHLKCSGFSPSSWTVLKMTSRGKRISMTRKLESHIWQSELWFKGTILTCCQVNPEAIHYPAVFILKSKWMDSSFWSFSRTVFPELHLWQFKSDLMKATSVTDCLNGRWHRTSIVWIPGSFNSHPASGSSSGFSTLWCLVTLDCFWLWQRESKYVLTKHILILYT